MKIEITEERKKKTVYYRSLMYTVGKYVEKVHLYSTLMIVRNV